MDCSDFCCLLELLDVPLSEALDKVPESCYGCKFFQSFNLGDAECDALPFLSI